MQLGTTKDQGLYNKPSAAVHPGALSARTLLQYNTRALINLQICYCLFQLWPLKYLVTLCMGGVHHRVKKFCRHALEWLSVVHLKVKGLTRVILRL